MAKMRVYDFAKEMKIEAKEIVSMLKGTQYEVKAAASNIEDDGQKYVREHLGGAPKTEKPKAEQPKEQAKPSQPKAEQPKTEQAKPAAEKPAEKSEARPKKKASISAVFNPQNSKQMSGGRRQSYHTNATDRSSRPQENRPSQARPQEARPVQPKPEQAKPVTEAKQPTEKPAEVKTSVTPEQPKAPERQVVNARMVQERIAAQARANGANRQRNNHQGNRPQGDRPQGDRNGGNRYQGNRNNNGRPYNNNGRPGSYGSNGQGGRNGAPNRNGQQGGRRLDQEINSFNKDSVKSAPEEIRTKESRENRDRDNRRNKNQDYDKLGSKKQERYINLEKNGGKKKKPQPQPQPKEEDTIRSISLPEHMTIKELADKMKVQASAIVKKLFLKGQMVTVNQEIKYEDAEEIALEFNCIAEPEVKVDVIAELLKEDEEDESTLVARPPVVCVMGHVDHGKTSLLDAIRNTHVTDREAGGITQHIGAYVVSINGHKITFLDTPGHEAFTAMRMRGAKSTDIAILVVAADDGVMPQTVEAINHAKAAGIEIIVAINKIDKPNANVDRVKQELSEYELIPEDWGGSTIFVPVSAHTHEGIDNLLEMILLTAEVCELKANPNRQARGVIIEAQLDKGRGAVATVLVQKGTLHVGEPIACGSAFGKVRAMIDDKGRRVKEAGPSTPVEILGLSSVPDAGETFVACESEKDARNFAETYISEGKEKLLEETRSRMSLDDLFSQIQSGNVKELDIIVKADVQGSVEAVKQSLVKLSNDEVVVKIIHGGVGAINESDVILASASNAIII